MKLPPPPRFKALPLQLFLGDGATHTQDQHWLHTSCTGRLTGFVVRFSVSLAIWGVVATSGSKLAKKAKAKSPATLNPKTTKDFLGYFNETCLKIKAWASDSTM